MSILEGFTIGRYSLGLICSSSACSFGAGYLLGASGRVKGALQASVTVRKCGVITKYTEISIYGNPLKFYFEHLAGDTHQFTAAPLHNEAMAASITVNLGSYIATM